MKLLNHYICLRRLALALAGFALISMASTIPSHAQSGAKARPSSKAVSNSKSLRGIGRLINSYRKSNGLGPVSYDRRLHQVAITQARLMAKHQKLTHATTWGAGLSSRMSQAGIRTGAAENLSMGRRTASQVIARWMRSSGHRANLLGNYNRFGMAFAHDSRGQRYWSLVLAR